VTTLILPKTLTEKPILPSLGPLVCEFLTGWVYDGWKKTKQRSDRWEGSIFGPGSLRGQPYELDIEKAFATYCSYMIYPPGHAYEGRRRFPRVGLSWRKGLAKTEWAAQVAYAELHPTGPVRFGGEWDRDSRGHWHPSWRTVRDPFIPMVAYTEEQTEELAYGALYCICTEGPDADLFDSGLDRIIRLGPAGAPDGKAVALASSPNANDGARTTFQHFDETHRMELPRLVKAHETMLQNTPKRILDDPWSLETTTAGSPGAGSVAEFTHREALLISEGKIDNPELFYMHREAGAHHNMRTVAGRVEAIAEATGPVGEYGPGQFERIARDYDRPGVDRTYWERVWLNRWTRSDAQAFDPKKFEALGREGLEISKGRLVTVGFDGARFRDATGIVLTDVKSGLQVPYGLWERPENAPEDWEVSEDEVLDAFKTIFKTWKVWQLYADPPHWQEEVGKIAGQWPDQVTEWWTNRRRPMWMALRAYKEAIESEAVTHNGSKDLLRHLGNAGRKDTNLKDEEPGVPVWILGKIRPEAKFDLCMAAVLSWQARLDALAAGMVAQQETFVPYRLDQEGRARAQGRDITVPGGPRVTYRPEAQRGRQFTPPEPPRPRFR
jgi:hypothetical protein